MQRAIAFSLRLTCGVSAKLPRPPSLLTAPHRQLLYRTAAVRSIMSYSIVERGSLHSFDYRVFFKHEDLVISPLHDIPLYAQKGSKDTYNMVVEVPRWTNAKMEISLDKKMNPIKQDVKKGKVRFVHNCFPHHGYIWNYGALPQTWEDPNHTDSNTGCKGDNDPIDVCEIGSKVHKRGDVVQVKPLGVMALIDEGETDWKVIAIDVTDDLAPQLNDIQDVETHMPGFLAATRNWFRIYKVPSGKPENQFAFGGEAKDRAFAMNIIEETHTFWQRLINKQVDNNGISCDNTRLPNSGYHISGEEAQAAIDESAPPGEAKPVDQEVHKWHYVNPVEQQQQSQ